MVLPGTQPRRVLDTYRRKGRRVVVIRQEKEYNKVVNFIHLSPTTMSEENTQAEQAVAPEAEAVQSEGAEVAAESTETAAAVESTETAAV